MDVELGPVKTTLVTILVARTVTGKPVLRVVTTGAAGVMVFVLVMVVRVVSKAVTTVSRDVGAFVTVMVAPAPILNTVFCVTSVRTRIGWAMTATPTSRSISRTSARVRAWRC